MNSCPIFDFCKCNPNEICLFCKVLTLIVAAVVSGAIGYYLGRKRNKK